MQRARTVVVSYPDSTFIEAMVIGVPTIGFWDPEIWQMRDDAAPFFDKLAAAGVVHATPEDAAARLGQIEDDPDWWQAREVQDARLEFIDRFGRSHGWLGEWTALLRDLADRA
jgi:putative transferase (TIGR04331 family)